MSRKSQWQNAAHGGVALTRGRSEREGQMGLGMSESAVTFRPQTNDNRVRKACMTNSTQKRQRKDNCGH